MYAIVEIQGKQFKVKENDKLEVDTLHKDSGNVTFDKVLLYAKDDKNIDIGHPYIDGAYIEAEILKPTRGEKIRVFKKKSKKRYERTQGFKRTLSLIQIKGIAFGAVKKAEPKAEPKKEVKEVKVEQAKGLDKQAKGLDKQAKGLDKVVLKPKAAPTAKATPAKKPAARAKKASNKEQAQLF